MNTTAHLTRLATNIIKTNNGNRADVVRISGEPIGSEEHYYKAGKPISRDDYLYCLAAGARAVWV